MEPLGLTANQVARLLHLGSARVGEIIKGRRAITCETALRLARLFGTSPRFWLELQVDYELGQAKQKWSAIVDYDIEPISATKPMGVIKRIDKKDLFGEKRLTAAKLDASNGSAVSAKKKAQNSLPASVKLTERQKKIYRFIPTDDLIYFDQLLAKTGLQVGELSGELTMLELDNLVERHPGDCYKRTGTGS
jgi:addiction module HigA family antidote